jgi:RNA polymerase sigma factor (sigma-70 family)
MPHAAIPFLSQSLRRLTSQYSDPSTDHDLLQRFVICHDEDAFAALVERHAAMVLGLCRSILRNHHDAEDIFQATILVLARKAGSIRKGASVGSWLYAVAYRMAHKARLRSGKQRAYEQQVPSTAEKTPMDEVTWGELRDILHEEVSRLPEKYRAAVILCYWQGRTHEQAGQQLGCARGTIKDRLEKARELLRKRLARRGLALSATWFAASLSEGTSAAVSTELMQTTVRGAMLFSMGQSPTGIVSAPAAALAGEFATGIVLTKFKNGLLLALMLGVVGGGAGIAALREKSASEHEPEASATAAAPKAKLEHIDRQEQPLPTGAVARLGTLRFRHSDSITDLAIGTDGKSILSASGKDVYVWDLASGKERRRFPHETRVTSFAESCDGKLLAVGCQDGTIHLWDPSTGRDLRHFVAHKGKPRGQASPPGVHVLTFTPDGRQIVSAGAEDSIRLWDVESGEQIREFDRFSQLAGIALSPDGKTLAGVVKNDVTWELRLWEVATGRERQRRPQPGKQLLSPAFSPDGKMLAIAVGELNWEKPCNIQLWDADASKEIRTLRGHNSWVSCRFAPNGKTLISWSNYRDKARLWDVNTGKEIRRINPDSLVPLTRLLFCPDGKSLASFTQGHHHIRFWDRSTGKELHSSGDAITQIDFLSFSPDGRFLAAGSRGDWAIRLWDVATRKNVRRLEHGLLTAMGFSPDGRRLASAAWTDLQVKIWDVAGSKELRRFPANKDAKSIDCMAWSGDGKILATWSYGNPVQNPIRLWNPDTGKPWRELSAGMDQIESLVFSPDSKLLAALGWERRSSKNLLLLWAVDTGRPLPSLEAPIGIANVGAYAHCRVAFSPDGRTLATGGQGTGSSIYLWEVASGSRRLTLTHGEDVASLAFSPDGKLLAAANNTNNANEFIAEGRIDPHAGGNPRLPCVHLWDVAAERELQSLVGHKGPITSLAFSPDGKVLATGSNDTTMLFWDATRFKTNRPPEAQLRPDQLQTLWNDLEGTDAVKAFRAIRDLADAPKSSVAFLRKRLRPVKPADSNQLARLLADLDNDEFAVRDKAMQQLEKLGDSAATELHKALESKPTLEVKRRIEQLLEKRNVVKQIRLVRALETLERIGTPEARELCAALADGVPDAPLTREARATLERRSK